jgi:hypothetical protein
MKSRWGLSDCQAIAPCGRVSRSRSDGSAIISSQSAICSRCSARCIALHDVVKQGAAGRARTVCPGIWNDGWMAMMEL